MQGGLCVLSTTEAQIEIQMELPFNTTAGSKKTATYRKHLGSRNNQQLFNSNCITLCLRDDFPVGSSHTKSVNFQNVQMGISKYRYVTNLI